MTSGSGKRMLFTEQLLREADMIVAYCPELDVSSCGYTFEEAHGNLQTAQRLLLEEAAKLGRLCQILSEVGYDTDQIEIGTLSYPPTFSQESM